MTWEIPTWGRKENPLEMARKLGQSIAGDLGSEAFIEMELSFATRLLPKFSDNPLIRVRQHVLLYWDQSYLKSTLIDAFSKTIPDSMKVADITSISPQKLFGSISEDRKHIVPPSLVGKHFTKISELLSFLGSGNTMRDIVNTMNEIMEGKPITRHLLKFGQIGFDSSEIERLRQKGIYYDPDEAYLSYTPDVCIWAASRPIDNRTYTYLRWAGHMYRYHVIQHEISDEEARRYLTENYYPDLELQGNLKTLNEQLSKIALKDLKMPTQTILEKVFTSLEDIVMDEIVARRRRLAEIVDIRTKGDMIRELVAHAFLRTVTENGFRDIDRLEYTHEDIEFILGRLEHFIEFKVSPLFVEEWTAPRVRKKRPKDQAKEFIVNFLSNGNVRGRSDIIEYVHNQIRVSIPTVDNALKELLSGRRICQPKYGVYKLKGEDCKSCEWRDRCQIADQSMP